MKLVSFINSSKEERLGFLIKKNIVDVQKAGRRVSINIPSKMLPLLENWDTHICELNKVYNESLDPLQSECEDDEEVKLLAPLPFPVSCRDAYSFKEHARMARLSRGLDLIPEFDQFPVFYFTNHKTIIGPGEVYVEEDHLDDLDFELEWAAVIGKEGKNIRAHDADQYISGYTIMNDFSARRLQSEEMKLNLGPAKGKDFATALGPWLVTPDELDHKRISTPRGSRYDLRMTAYHNGKLVSQGNTKDMHWTFAEIIERCSYGVTLYPGDVIGSGTVGTGCFLEINGTQRREAKAKAQKHSPTWLRVGDTIELEIEGLGRLSHRVCRSPQPYSLLSEALVPEEELV